MIFSACFTAWLVLSSCLGVRITRPLHALWEYMLQSAQASGNGLGGSRGVGGLSGVRRRRELGFSEADVDTWEMEVLGGRRG